MDRVLLFSIPLYSKQTLQLYLKGHQQMSNNRQNQYSIQFLQKTKW